MIWLYLPANHTAEIQAAACLSLVCVAAWLCVDELNPVLLQSGQQLCVRVESTAKHTLGNILLESMTTVVFAQYPWAQ